MPWGRSFRRRTQAGSQPLHRQEPDAALCHICAETYRSSCKYPPHLPAPTIGEWFHSNGSFGRRNQRFKRRCFDFREMVTGVDRLPVGVREDQFFVGRIPQCFDKFVRFHLVVSFSISTSCLRRWISATAEANRQGCFVDSVLGEQIDRG